MKNKIKKLTKAGICNTDISILLGMRYDDIKIIMEENNIKGVKWNQKIYPYIYYNKDYNKYYYVMMKSNKKFFYEFDNKESLFTAIKNNKWKTPKIIGEYI